MIYKVKIEKIVYVEADSPEEAEESYNIGSFYEEETVTSVCKSKRPRVHL